MGFLIFLIIIFAITIIIVFLQWLSMTPEEREKAKDNQRTKEKIKKWGTISPTYICPHCQEKGFVRTLPVKRKKGVSGAKATGALLTLGVSMLATGLSRKEGLTQACCDNCGSTWDF